MNHQLFSQIIWQLIKYKVDLLGNPVIDNNVATLDVKVVVPLKYLRNFFRSLEMPLINSKIKLNLEWKKECVLSTDDDATADNAANNPVFIINDTKLYVPVVTLSKEDNKDFIEQENKGFRRSSYWNEYKTKVKSEDADNNVFKYITLDLSFQGDNRLFVMEYNREDNQLTRNERTKYYLLRIYLKNIMLLSMEEIFTIIR